MLKTLNYPNFGHTLRPTISAFDSFGIEKLEVGHILIQSSHARTRSVQIVGYLLNHGAVCSQ